MGTDRRAGGAERPDVIWALALQDERAAMLVHVKNLPQSLSAADSVGMRRTARRADDAY